MIRANNWISIDGTIVAVIVTWDDGEECLYKRSWFEAIASAKQRGVCIRKDFARNNTTSEEVKTFLTDLKSTWELEVYPDKEKFQKLLGTLNAISGNSDFYKGQIWRYITRPGEENSYAFIGHTDEESVHFALVGLNMKVPDPRGLIDSKKIRCPVIGHVALTIEKFRESVIEPIHSDSYHKCLEAINDAKLKDTKELFLLFTEGYQSFKNDESVPFDDYTIAQVVDNMERAMQEGPASYIVEDDDADKWRFEKQN